MAHKITYMVKNYPLSGFAHTIRYACTCGLSGMLTDGRTAPTRRAAKAAHDRKAAKKGSA
jgi:hypothetical protein